MRRNPAAVRIDSRCTVLPAAGVAEVFPGAAMRSGIDPDAAPGLASPWPPPAPGPARFGRDHLLHSYLTAQTGSDRPSFCEYPRFSTLNQFVSGAQGSANRFATIPSRSSRQTSGKRAAPSPVIPSTTSTSSRPQRSRLREHSLPGCERERPQIIAIRIEHVEALKQHREGQRESTSSSSRPLAPAEH